MKHTKKTALILTALMALSACGNGNTKTETTEAPTAATTAAQAAAETTATAAETTPEETTTAQETDETTTQKVEESNLPDGTIGDFEFHKGVLTKYNGEGGDIVIPEGTVKIGQEAFIRSRLLTSVVFPDTVTEIDTRAFCQCKLLDSVTLNNGIKTLGIQAFAECDSLQKSIFPRDSKKSTTLASATASALWI